MSERSVIRIAIQKSGRLSSKCISLLDRCGIDFEIPKNLLLSKAQNYPIELLLIRDDDIPAYVADGVCDMGIVGLNELEEKLCEKDEAKRGQVEIIRNLGFGRCRLALALPNKVSYNSLSDFEGMNIASSYPMILKNYMKKQGVNVNAVDITGSVEVAPAIGIADAVCDLVSTGATLITNGLREVATVMESEAVLIKNKKMDENVEKQLLLSRLLDRIDGVLKAQQARYVMMNAPKDAIDKICEVLPGMENPTIMNLGSNAERVAIHAVAPNKLFWETMEKLKELGATSILAVPIEKIID